MTPGAGQARRSTSAVDGSAACRCLETTELCRQITGNTVEIGASSEDRPGDIPIYVSDCSQVYGMTDWRPRRGPSEILTDIHAWILAHESALTNAL